MSKAYHWAMDRRDLGAGGALLIAALVWAAPVVSRLDTHLPGTAADHDVATMIWNVGWVQRAIETPAPLFRSDAVLLPFGADLRAHTYGAFAAALVWPVAHTAGALTAFNVMVIGTLVLNGWLSYLLFREIPACRAAALVAASALMLGGPALDQFRVGRPIFASLWITCAALIAARRLLARPGVAWTVVLGATLVAALFTDLQMLLFTSVWLAWLAVWTLASERGIDARRAAAAAAAVAIVAVPLFAIVYPAFSGGSSPALSVPGREEAVRYSLRWWDYFVPSVMPRAVGGYELAIAGVAGLALMRRDARLRVWLFGAVWCFVLAQGPTLKFTGLPLPFAWFNWWPPLEQFRTPYRLTIPATVGLAAVMALVLDRAFARLPPRRVAWVVAAALALRVALASVQHPLQTQAYPAFETYRRLADAGDTGAVIEVPFGVRSGLDRIGGGGETLQYYQHVHGRPIINAMVARLPPEVFAFFRRHPALLVLAGEPVQAPHAAVAADLGAVIDLVAARYVLVHHELMAPDHAARVDRLLNAHPRLHHWVSEGDLVAYRIVTADGTGPQHEKGSEQVSRSVWP
jgi:hypothetical protein